MSQNYVVEHIGYVTKNIEKTANTFKVFGYVAENIVNDDIQKTRICFLRKEGDVSIELVPDVLEAYTQLKDQGFTPLFSPVEAPAFGNRLICYFWKNDIGLIEVVEQEKGE